jgi:hypothetical protein
MVLVSQTPYVPPADGSMITLLQVVSDLSLPELGRGNRGKDGLGALLAGSSVRLLAVTKFLYSAHFEGCLLCQLSDPSAARHQVEEHSAPLPGYNIAAWKHNYTFLDNSGHPSGATQYICFPASDVILEAADERSFAEVLARSQKVSHEGPPPAIARYRDQAAQDAPLWAIRSEPRQIDQGNGEDPRTPPSAPSAICFEGHRDGSIEVRFLGFDDPATFAKSCGVKLSQVGPLYETRLTLTKDKRNGYRDSTEPISCEMLLGFRFYI